MIKTCVVCGRQDIIVNHKGECWICAKKAAQERIANEIKSGETCETFQEDEIFCPWCGEHYEPCLADGLPEGEHECFECGKRYRVECCVDVSYSTVRLTEGGEGQ